MLLKDPDHGIPKVGSPACATKIDRAERLIAFKKGTQGALGPEFDVSPDTLGVVVEVPLVEEREGEVFDIAMVGGRDDGASPGLEDCMGGFHEVVWVKQVFDDFEANRDIEGFPPFLWEVITDSKLTHVDTSDALGNLKAFGVRLHGGDLPTLAKPERQEGSVAGADIQHGCGLESIANRKHCRLEVGLAAGLLIVVPAISLGNLLFHKRMRLEFFTIFDGLAGMSGTHFPIGHVLGHHRACSDHSPLAYRDTGVNERLGRHPCVVADGDWCRDQGEACFFVIVGPRTKVGTLRNDDALAKFDGALRVENDPVRTARFISDFEIPRRPDFDAGIDVDADPQLRAKDAEQKSTPRVEWTRTPSKNRRLDSIPSNTREPVGKGKTWPRVGVFIYGHISKFLSESRIF